MNKFNKDQTVGKLVEAQPALSAVFQDLGVDFCCGGGKTLEQACQKEGVDLHLLLEALEKKQFQLDMEGATPAPGPESLAQLCDQIEQGHHAYLKSELPRLDMMTEKVARVHGDKDARLLEIRRVFAQALEEIGPHMMKEEQVIFPLIRRLESGDFQGASLAEPIRQLESDHDSLGEALKAMRKLSDGYQPPEWSCNTYRAMLDGLQRLEKDLHLHVHKENNVLFPRALELQASPAPAGA